MAGPEKCSRDEQHSPPTAEDENNQDQRSGGEDEEHINVEDTVSLDQDTVEGTEQQSPEMDTASANLLHNQPGTTENENEIEVADIEGSPPLEDHATLQTGLRGEQNEVQGEAEQSEDQAPISDVNDRLMKLPLSRIKHIIKMDPDVTLASQEAVATIARATELFIGALSRDASYKTIQGRRRVVLRKDLALLCVIGDTAAEEEIEYTMDTRDCYAFLEGAMDS